MTEERFAQILALGHEVPGIEVKGPGSRSTKSILAGVVRAVLGMANRRDGGLVIVGVEESGSTFFPIGLTNEDLITWEQEALTGALAAYAEPYVEIHAEQFVYMSKVFVIITVEEFHEIPVLCKKDFDQKLRAGGCYVRRRGRIETSEIPTQAEMRELLELATEKRLRSFLQQTQRAFLTVRAEPLSADLFDEELGEF